METILKNRGWVMYYECKKCGHRKYFIHNEKKGYEVRIRLKSNTFSFLKDNYIIAGQLLGFHLEKKLNEFGL